MSTAYLIFLSVRVLIIVMSIEVVARYAWWWVKVLRGSPNEILGKLLKGIWVYHAAVAGILGYFGWNSTNYSVRYDDIWIPILLALLACYGTFVHLVPCWRISNNATAMSIAMSLLVRGVIAGFLTFSFVRYRGF